MRQVSNPFRVVAKEQQTDFQGIPVVIEHAKGSVREGVDGEGKPWQTKMMADYGYVPDTISTGDGENVDVYIGTDLKAPMAFVIEQLKEDDSFDEMKICLGFKDEESARACYLEHYPEGWESQIGGIWSLPVRKFKQLVEGHSEAV